MATSRRSTQTQDMKPEVPFSFPTLGESGMTIYASSQEEANEKAAKIRKELSRVAKELEKAAE